MQVRIHSTLEIRIPNERNETENKMLNCLLSNKKYLSCWNVRLATSFIIALVIKRASSILRVSMQIGFIMIFF